MRWDVADAADYEQDLILFDGDCVLCSHWAGFVHRRDNAHRFKFSAIQSPFGRSLAALFGVDPETPQTNIAIIGGRAFFKSDAAIAILAALPGWGWVRAARIAPKPLRDWLYDRIAGNRYAVFGRRARCWAGDSALKSRIVEDA